mmetsp:Transcript_14332/g.35997  ORF Transcript_14332/g.35997 Transcript_14332/m.35997 type:complete len:225 (+) Transcript_14332:64-738(+)
MASSCALSSSALSSFNSFCITLGAPSTISFASLSPKPAIFRTSLMTLILALASKPTSLRSKIVFSSAAASSAPPPEAAALTTGPPPSFRCSVSLQLIPICSLTIWVRRWTSIMSSHNTLSKIACTLSWEASDSGSGGAKLYVTSVAEGSSSLLASSGDDSSSLAAGASAVVASSAGCSSSNSAANKDKGEEWKQATVPAPPSDAHRFVKEETPTENPLADSDRR